MSEKRAAQARADARRWVRDLAETEPDRGTVIHVRRDRPDPLPRGVIEAEQRCTTCRGYGVVDGFFGSVSRCEDCQGKG